MTAAESGEQEAVTGGLVGRPGEEAYRIDGVERMAPFLMTVVSDTDLWMFVSSTGALTAGRVDADHSLFPYETDDRLHRAAGLAGPVTVIARGTGHGREHWQPFGPSPTPGCRRTIIKRTLGNHIVFEEHRPAWGLTYRASWSPSDRYGWVRTVELSRDGATPAHQDDDVLEVEVLDGLVDVMPSGVDALTEQTRSNLVDAYKRAEIDPGSSFAMYALESLISDRAEPLEALTATCVWSTGFAEAQILLDTDAVGDMIGGRPASPSTIVTGRPGAYLLRGPATITAGNPVSWTIVADTDLDAAGIADAMRTARSEAALERVVEDVELGSVRLAALVEGADAFQHTADRIADAHHLSNVLFNCMRGGVFPSGGAIPVDDLRRFVTDHNREVLERHRGWFDRLGTSVDEGALRVEASDTGDPDLQRLVLEYLPLTFSRRHGDPSRPWNRFSIDVRDDHGEPLLSYEGNWRDIFQNWEALLQSYPTFFANVVAKFLNATTIEGYNPYRISRAGIDWEVPDPDDPWSHIGYWGDHQIVYLMRLLEMWERYAPEGLADWLEQDIFVHAEVPYTLASHDAIVADPRNTITYDVDRAADIARREEQLGADGRLLVDADGGLVHVGLLEKLVVPALAKLANFVPDGGIWLNTQRPEWNDANNALAGPGLSMVTLYHLRRYLGVLASIATTAGDRAETVLVTESVARWIDDVRQVFVEVPARPLDDGARRAVVDRLGRSADAHRRRVRSGAAGARVAVPVADVVELCTSSRAHLDVSIDAGRRTDGLYDSYNLVSFPADDAAHIDHLGPMLEGQVAALSSGALTTDAALAVVDALLASAMYRADQDTFMLYPPAELPPFRERNLIGPAAGQRLDAVRDAITDAVITADVDGRLHFQASIVNAKTLERVLDDAGATEEERATLRDIHEQVFDHRSFTGRSGRMHGYEGIGSVYWHMVAKLLVAVQELYWDAVAGAEPDPVLARVADAYRRIRTGLGYHKSPAEFGAIPTDCYSHTPAHAGAQQPGMTGQVKEEILTRFGELGLRVEDGRLCVLPGLLAPEALFGRDDTGWSPARLTVCGTPVSIDVGADDAIVVERSEGSETVAGRALPIEISAEVFARTGNVTGLRWIVGDATLARWRELARPAR